LCFEHVDKWERISEDLRNRGKIDLSEAFVDATFAGAKKGLRRPPYSLR
jgi:hypothetical protein